MLLIIMSRGNAIRTVIPTIGLFAIAAVRLMPSMNQIVSCVNSMKFGTAASEDIYNDMKGFREQMLIRPSSVKRRQVVFSKDIEAKNLVYQYPESDRPALNNVNLRIGRGESIALVGPSGSGKTTFVNCLMGLLSPTNGKILIDGGDIWQDRTILAGWQHGIGYVPQDIYLIDDTLRNNIGFGIEPDEIVEEHVLVAIKGARLEGMVKDLSQGVNSFVGEKGVRLSGGQRQRVGIARALYHNPEVIVMDEATSSLDNETEKKISSAIQQLSNEKTIILIAHRLSTVKNCDRLFFFKDGSLIDSGPFDRLIEENVYFRRMAQHGEFA